MSRSTHGGQRTYSSYIADLISVLMMISYRCLSEIVTQRYYVHNTDNLGKVVMYLHHTYASDLTFLRRQRTTKQNPMAMVGKLRMGLGNFC